jgi:hypothetical protein
MHQVLKSGGSIVGRSIVENKIPLGVAAFVFNHCKIILFQNKPFVEQLDRTNVSNASLLSI